MKVHDNLEIVLRRPSDSFDEVRKLSLNKWFTSRNIEGPVSNGDSDMVKSVNDSQLSIGNVAAKEIPCSGNLSKINLRNECVPVLLEHRTRLGWVLILPERIFIHNTIISSVIEERWCDPWLFTR